MPSPNELDITIRTTATGDGAKKAEADLKKLNEEAKKSEPVWKSASERIAEAEGKTAQMGTTAVATAGSAGVGGLAAAAGLAAGGFAILASSVAGLNKLAPTLGASFGSIGTAIKDSFLEVMGGSLKAVIEDVFGADFEEKLQRIAEGFGAATTKMTLMGQASADYISNQRTLVELLKEENTARETATTAANNRARELREEIELQETLKKNRDGDVVEDIERDPRLPAGEKARAKEHINVMAEIRAKEAADELRASRRADIDRKEREAAKEFNSAYDKDQAAEGISRGDYRKSGVLPSAQAQQLKDAQGRLAAEDNTKQKEKIKKEIEALLKIFEDARRAAEKEFTDQAEAARTQRVTEDNAERLEQDAYDRKQRGRDRDAPINELKRQILDDKSNAARIAGEADRLDTELGGKLKDIANDPKLAQDPNGAETKATINKIADAMERGAATAENLKQLGTILDSVKTKVSENGQSAIEASTSMAGQVEMLLGAAKTLLQRVKQLDQKVLQFQSQVDS